MSKKTFRYGSSRLLTINLGLLLSTFLPVVSYAQSTGSIEGKVIYRSEYTPALKICAQSIENPYLLNCIETEPEEGLTTYRLNIKPGRYFVFAVDVPLGEGNTIYHTQGDQFLIGYDDPHVARVVNVVAGQSVTGVDIGDPWICGDQQFRSRYCIYSR